MEINNVFIEHWPLLQCVNVFISFTENISDSINVSVKNNKIALKYDKNSTTIELSNRFQLQLHTLSLLMIEKNYITFRLNTNTDNNHFELEYIDCSNSSKDIKSSDPPKITIKPNENCTIICSNCTCQLSEMLHFQRILELPSQNLDINDWFCHKPHQTTTTTSVDVNDNNNKEKPSSPCTTTTTKFNANKFEANANDLLYGHFCVLINAEKFRNIKQKQNTIYCKRCLKYIGEMYQKSSIKIWNENVTIINRNDVNSNFFTDSTSIWINFMFIIEKMLKDFNFSDDVGMMPINKILIEADSLNGKYRRYLFLQILKRNLDIYTSFDSNGNNNNQCLSSINLQKINAMKIQFSVCNKIQDTNEELLLHQRRSYALLKFWQNDATVVQFEISRQMFDVSVKNLIKNSNFIADCYRNSNDGFILSYLY